MHVTLSRVGVLRSLFATLYTTETIKGDLFCRGKISRGDASLQKHSRSKKISNTGCCLLEVSKEEEEDYR